MSLHTTGAKLTIVVIQFVWHTHLLQACDTFTQDAVLQGDADVGVSAALSTHCPVAFSVSNHRFSKLTSRGSTPRGSSSISGS